MEIQRIKHWRYHQFGANIPQADNTVEAKMSEKLELRLEEIEARYAGEWVLVEEIAWDERGNPAKGVVIAHGSMREVLVQPTRRLHAQKPEARTFTFYAGPKVPEDLVVVLL